MDEHISEEEAENTFQDFFDSLGPNDIYKMIFLETLLEEMYGRQVNLSKFFKLE